MYKLAHQRVACLKRQALRWLELHRKTWTQRCEGLTANMEDIGIHTPVEAPFLVEHHLVFGIEGQLMCHILIITVGLNRVSLCLTIGLIVIKTVVSLWLEAMIGIVLTKANVVTRAWAEVESCSIANVINR